MVLSHLQMVPAFLFIHLFLLIEVPSRDANLVPDDGTSALLVFLLVDDRLVGEVAVGGLLSFSASSATACCVGRLMVRKNQLRTLLL